MNRDAVLPGGLFQAFQVKLVIIIAVETYIAIIAALNNVTGNTGQVHTGFSWHGVSSSLRICKPTLSDHFILENYSRLSPTPLAG
jgi:hypothetical protein